MKIFITIILISALIFMASVFSYKQGVKDSAALAWFSYAGHSYLEQKILREEGQHALLEFLVNDISSSIDTHKNLLESQSIFSQYFGPINEINTNNLHYIDWFTQIKSDDHFTGDKNLQNNLSWLLKNAKQ